MLRPLRRFLAAAVIAVAIVLSLALLPVLQWSLAIWYGFVREDLDRARWAEALPDYAERALRRLHHRLRG